MDELKKAIAFVFRTRGGGQMLESAFRDIVSFNLRWFSPDEAKRMVAMALEANIISMKDGMLIPNFDVSATELPLAYKPGPDVFATASGEETTKEGGGDDVLMMLLGKIEKDAKLPRKQLMSRINAVQKEMGIDIEVAALIVASDYNINVRSLVGIVEERVLAKYENGMADTGGSG
jgi:hypothetical protein